MDLQTSTSKVLLVRYVTHRSLLRSEVCSDVVSDDDEDDYGHSSNEGDGEASEGGQEAK